MKIRFASTQVTSLAEVWIEIYVNEQVDGETAVTSLAEVWIEITKITKFSPKGLASLPLRKSGLKSGCLIFCFSLVCHFPCGSVD